MSKGIQMITLDNGDKYYEADSVIYNNIKYLFLCNTNNIKDICIMKSIINNGYEELEYLDSDKEYEIVIKLFRDKNKNLFK